MREVLAKVKNKAAIRYPRATGTVVTVIGRVRSRKQRDLRVSHDGQDWIHIWSDGILVTEAPSPSPRRAITRNLPLFLERFKPDKGQTIVDVGAGIGTDVCAFSSMVGDEGRVICIEADPEAFRCLSKTVALAGLRNVVTIHKAVTNCEGQVFLAKAAASVSNSVMTEGERGVVVQSTTLDRLLDEIGIETIDYLKMNIEGAEVLALEGFATGPRRVRNWCISCHDFKQGSEFQTFDRVERWMARQALTIWRHERNDSRPWESFYLYGRSNP